MVRTGNRDVGLSDREPLASAKSDAVSSVSRRLGTSTELPLMPFSGHYPGSGMIVLMTEWQLHVSLAELRRSIDLLMDHVAATTDDDTIRLDRDYFWSIGEDE